MQLFGRRRKENEKKKRVIELRGGLVILIGAAADSHLCNTSIDLNEIVQYNRFGDVFKVRQHVIVQLVSAQFLLLHAVRFHHFDRIPFTTL